VGARLHTTHTYTVYMHTNAVYMWLHTREHDDITFNAVVEEDEDERPTHFLTVSNVVVLE